MVPLIAPISVHEASYNRNKPTLRSPAITSSVRKADDANLDDISSLASSNKKLKVTFGMDTRNDALAGTFSRNITNTETVRIEVKRAINAHFNGNSEGYDVIKAVFSPPKNDDNCNVTSCMEMKNYLIALTSTASLLNKTCSGLVKTVLALEWMGRDEFFVKIYIYFLGSLASAQALYVDPILEMLVSHFLGVNLSLGRLDGCREVSRAELLSRVHAALKYILRLIPSASSILLSICTKRFPFADDKPKLHLNYVDNLIQVTSYAPELKLDILALITDRLIKIDVQMQVDLDDLDDEVVSTIINQTSLILTGGDKEDKNGTQSETDSVISDDDVSIDSQHIKGLRENVEKMDHILDMLFIVYSPYFFDPNSVEAVSMFETLLAHFTNIILPTYRSRHTQFILFHFAQKSEQLVDQFAGTCVQLAFLPGQPDILKQAAAAYLASFVARGARVKAQVVRTIFEIIGSNLDHIRAENELTCRGPDLKRYGTFYALTQALLYIFCFRWRDLVTSTEILESEDPVAFLNQDLVWTPGIKDLLSRTIYSKLNPLKICSPSIVAEFAKTANYLKFMYVFPLLETNKRIRLGQFSSINSGIFFRDHGTACHSNSWHQLDAYFPFDPYQLPISKRWVENDYVLWKSIPGLNHEDEESEDEESPDIEEFSDTSTENYD